MCKISKQGSNTEKELCDRLSLVLERGLHSLIYVEKKGKAGCVDYFGYFMIG